MLRTEHSTAIALVASLLLHGSIFYIYSEVAPEPGTLPAPALVPVAAAEPKPITLLVDVASPVSSPPEPLPMPEPLPELAQLQKLRPLAIIPLELAPDMPPPPKMEDAFGELSGSPNATSLHSLSGDLPMQARKADQDQAHTSRELPAESQASPAPAVAAAPEAPSIPENPPLARVALATPPPPSIAVAPAPLSAADPALPGRHVISVSPPATAPAEVAMVPASPATAPAIEPNKAGTKLAMLATPRLAEAASTAGDGAAQSDSESDPFAVRGSAEFRPGKVTARFGRKVKTVRPRLSLAGQYDLFTAEPSVVLRVRTDTTGKVREVTIARSSGSRDVDQPCQLAMYEWWFEPPRDSSGNPRSAEMLWTISFRAR